MNTVIDCPSVPPTLVDPPRLPAAPSDRARGARLTARFCPDCGAQVMLSSPRHAVPCSGCGAVHAAARFAPSWLPARRRGWLRPMLTEAASLLAQLFDPNAYMFVKGLLASRGWG